MYGTPSISTSCDEEDDEDDGDGGAEVVCWVAFGEEGAASPDVGIKFNAGTPWSRELEVGIRGCALEPLA